MTSYESYKNLISVFETLKKPISISLKQRTCFDLSKLDALTRNDLVTAYYQDDCANFDGDMFSDAMCDQTLRNAVINLLDMRNTDVNKLTFQRDAALNLLWDEVGHAVQGLFDEFIANYKQDYIMDSIGDDEYRISRHRGFAFGGV